MGLNPDGVIGRHGDGEKKIVLLWVPESPFLRVLLPTSPIFHYSTTPLLHFDRLGGSTGLLLQPADPSSQNLSHL